MSGKIKETAVDEKTFTAVERMINLIGKHGPLKIIGATLLFVFFSWMTYIAFNPSFIFNKYEEYASKVHNASVDFRMESAPIIRTYLNQLALETGAERAYILEFHNGKSNPSGLQWQFGDLTFINDGTDDISDEIQNVSLSRYNFANIVHNESYWAGGIDELINLDERFYNRMRLNGGVFYAFQMIYGTDMRELGILGISYIDKDKLPDRHVALAAVHKYAAAISPYLDEKSIRK